jgi:hypothetical protein
VKWYSTRLSCARGSCKGRFGPKILAVEGRGRPWPSQSPLNAQPLLLPRRQTRI